jgi:tRNA (adenine22-N1)-methyltransferase
MGGTLIAQILDVTPPLMGAKKCVMQPMRGAEDIRSWLYERLYPVLEDRVVLDAGRYYQVFSVGEPTEAPQPLPNGWPQDCFLVGYRAFQTREPMMKTLVEHMLATTNRKLRTQHAEALLIQRAQLEQILERWEQEE